ncbi:AraC family transcriptional regulator [Solobacterium sp.]|uniref:AraC family transcriptional regulator n=1 Tax=Solobacterium sp. TaxID=2060878 RepID=UPI001CAAF0A1|nr:AraC family transcriptional regulator [Solobacterium sp.]MBF1084988.1 helix-turn-helix transcriptional regulator [Solobacterium sp.]MBF1107980.1 helix-turn-helix transcriptional regulator [Solobacterium sp.]
MNQELPLVIEKENFDTHKQDELAHWHNSFELIEVVEGKFFCNVDGSEFLINKGNICIINRGRLHHIYTEDRNAFKCRKKTIIFNPDYFIKDQNIYEKYILPLLEKDAFAHIQFNIKKGIGLDINTLMKEIEALEDEKPIGYELEEYSLIYKVIRYLYLAYQSSKQTIHTAYDANVQIQRNMTSFIHEHFGSKIGLEDIAEAGQVSKSTCIRLFHKYTGKSPIDFLNSYRLQMSAEKLVATSEQITEIAYACGFGQPSYFNRLFLKEYNITPNQYRKQHARMKS